MQCLEDIQELVDEQVDNILMPHQKKALEFLDNGKILYGGVGSGKSCTAMGYYMKKEFGRDVYIITTAKKRDSLDWVGESARFGIGPRADATVGGVLRVDSWHNIGRYEEVRDGFFIFDEQRLVGTGAWVKSFLRIVRRNRWILLSATPGDEWLDYLPVFLANEYYRNITDFKRQHVVYRPYVKYPIVDRYVGIDKLERLRNEVLVEMPYLKHTERVVNYLEVGYDRDELVRIQKTRWNPTTDEPFTDYAEMWRYIRRLVNTDPSRIDAVRMLLEVHPRLIVFYNFDYELELLRTGNLPGKNAEWNGHKHEELPGCDAWVYFVQYQAGAEGWNCTSTDAMCFFSLTYSYKNWEQAQGRIDRLNSPYTKLYYYVLKSGAWIDTKLVKTMAEKKNFNERKGLKEWISHEHLAVPRQPDALDAKYLPGV